MELRVLHYFLTVAREQSISGAAEFLHLSQPTLSRQLKELENELGKQLFLRGSRRITLTEEGRLLKKRAEEILSLVRKTENEISMNDTAIAGDIYIGAAETQNIRMIAHAARHLQTMHPQIRYHISSSDIGGILDKLDQGLIDFGIVVEGFDTAKYDFLPLPLPETWCALMRKDNPLASKTVITAEDLQEQPLIVSRQSLKVGKLLRWLGKSENSLNIIATYSLLYNASLLVEEGLGCALGFERLINTTGNSLLCSRPLSPVLETPVSIIWKKYQIFSRASAKFLKMLQEILAQPEQNNNERNLSCIL